MYKVSANILDFCISPVQYSRECAFLPPFVHFLCIDYTYLELKTIQLETIRQYVLLAECRI